MRDEDLKRQVARIVPTIFNKPDKDTISDLQDAVETIAFRLQSAKDFFKRRDFELLLQATARELHYHFNELEQEYKNEIERDLNENQTK